MTTSSPTLLVVDDEPLVLSAFRRILASDYSLTMSSGAVEALALLGQGQRFDVILCDLMMPEMTGMEFYEVLGRSFPDLTSQVVFIAGGAVTPLARNFVATIGNAVLQKPCETALLRAALKRALVARLRRQEEQRDISWDRREVPPEASPRSSPPGALAR